MTEIDDGMLRLALTDLGLEDEGSLGSPGGQKAVRRVRREGEHLVLKVIALTPSAPDALRRAEREVELLTAISSKNVVAVVSDLVELGEPVVGVAWLEEYLDGEDLTPLLGRPWPWQDAREMSMQVANGLAVAHDVGVVHRDLSSNNVRRISSGDYKVLDFGFARHTLRSGLTVAGQPGTAGFLTPEHLNSYSGGPMPPSDIFGVGILLYAALVGKLPIAYMDDIDDYLMRVVRVEIDPEISTARPDLGKDQLALIRRCLHPQPARRFRNGRALLAALEKIS